MKKTILTLSLAAIAGLILAVSCQKTYNPYQTVTANQSLNQLFAGLRSTPQTLTVTAGTDAVVYAAQGTKLHFYPNSFRDAYGNNLTSGTVTVQIIEMYKPGDMIANRATTMANGQILQSGGQVSITATMNGQAVYTNGYGVGFKHGTSSTQSMALFYGGTGNADSTVGWTLGDTSHHGATAGGTTYDTVTAGLAPANFFFDTCKSFNFVNCDCFYHSDSAKTSVNVVLPNATFTSSNTTIYLVLPNITPTYNPTDTFNAVLSSDYGRSGYTASSNTMQLTSDGQTNIVPAGLNYELVVIANVNGQFYYWETSGIVPHSGITVNATLAADGQSDIISRLQGL